MKIEKYNWITEKTVITVTRREAIALIATLSSQLHKNESVNRKAEMVLENGERFSIIVDFSKE